MAETLPMIPVAKPLIGEAEHEAARRPILSGWVTQGPEVRAFEEEFAAAVGAPHACAVSNCTTALHLALLAVGVRPGDEVITASHSFIATANAVRYCGATPVFVDVDARTYNLDPAACERAIGPRTRAILVVHQIGMPADLAALVPLARKHGVALIEDAACAAGSEIQWNGAWERIGAPHGDIACFSFHPRKLVTTGDGGMLTTRNPDFDKQFRLWRQHAMSVPDTVRHASAQVIFETYPMLGFNYRMTDIQAAVGREQLKRLPGIVARRRELAAVYHRKLAGIAGLGLPHEPEWARTNWQSYSVRLPDGVEQRAAMQLMLDRGVQARRGIMNSHREPAFGRGPGAQPWRCGPCEPAAAHDGCTRWSAEDPAGSHCARLTQSELAQDRNIILPLFHQLTDAEQERVVDALAAACAR